MTTSLYSAETLPTMLEEAAALVERGFWVAPLCWPNARKQCGCPKGHTGYSIGKAPLTSNGIKDATNQVKGVFDYWKRWPLANIAIDLERSGLLVVAPDSPGWLAEFVQRGLPPTLVAQSGGGEGHFHFYYRRPEGCPIHRINKSGEYDMQTGGYVVALPSLHQSGRLYQWVRYDTAIGGAS